MIEGRRRRRVRQGPVAARSDRSMGQHSDASGPVRPHQHRPKRLIWIELGRPTGCFGKTRGRGEAGACTACSCAVPLDPSPKRPSERRDPILRREQKYERRATGGKPQATNRNLDGRTFHFHSFLDLIYTFSSLICTRPVLYKTLSIHPSIPSSITLPPPASSGGPRQGRR